MPLRIRAQPCAACPYRKDVPSGVWSSAEYLKLIAYDNPTFEQPVEWFGCHATPEFTCHGWAVVHSNRGHEFELLALRMFRFVGKLPKPTMPLFNSGTEAAAHGMRAINRPGKRARETMARLVSRYSRLRHHNDPDA